ncbi:hypothetical protein BGZ99_002714 [Dissophora globulifera]|uniref:Uncharacterized protein n=1 Tax=Dissophora globulifera TaxID=979702 RepID=A0A9P6UXD9_9FUNG|nr:hypothetical protein BGZ99_002714 [Dissophora globulifera]
MDYDDDDNDDDSDRWSLSDSHSITTDSDWGNYRTRSESRSRSRSHSRRSTKRLKRRRRERYDSSDISDGGPGTSVESDGAASDSDIPLALRSDRRPLPRASGSSNPLARLDGPMTKMTAEIDSYLDKTMLRLEKTKQGMKKMEKVFKRFQTEMRELEKEMAIYRSQLTTSIHPPPQDTYSAGQSIVQHPRSRTNSTQSEVAAISESIRKEPIPPPPSLRPVPSTLRLKTEGLGYSVPSHGQGGLNSGVVMLKMSATPSRAVQLAFSGPRSAGYRRVMDKSSYQLPIASQPTMSVLALGKRSRHAGIFGRRRPGFMHLNPFSYQTPFEGIAASSSLDGTIQFWDINKQQLLLSVALKDNRAIPFAEALTWVREDAIAVVSHLKDGVDWPDPGAILTEDPGPLSPPESQTMVLTIYFGQDGKLKHRLLTFLDKPHIHWDFEAPDANGMNELRPAGLHQLHRLHSNSVNSLSYCHQSKILYSGGRDKRYIAFDMMHEKVVRQLMLGPIAHIVENPVDPRINLVTLMGTKDQYILMDERTPDSPVLTVGYPSDKTVSRLSAPTWHSEGGLVCAGAVNKGLINLWDVRWSGIGSDFSRRPGAGVVTGDVQFDNVVVGATKHPVFHSTLPAGYRRFGGKTMGGPSQILDVGGEIVMQACFHPNKNVLMVLNRDCSLTFMDYKIRSDLIQ